jgi:biopolymer transport protein ExbD
MFRSIQGRGEKGGAEIPIAPLIDIICILLFFFLVTAQFSKEMGVEVQRPSAQIVQSIDARAMRVAVTVGGEIYTEGRRVTLGELRSLVTAFVTQERKKTVVVVADAGVPAGRLIEVMDVARQAGASEVAVAARKEANG